VLQYLLPVRQMMEVYLLLSVVLARRLLPLPVLLQPVVEVVGVVRRPELLGGPVVLVVVVVHIVLAAVERVFPVKVIMEEVSPAAVLEQLLAVAAVLVRQVILTVQVKVVMEQHLL
jgi:hypothetical protein